MNAYLKLQESSLEYRWLIPLISLQCILIGFSAYYPVYVLAVIAGVFFAFYSMKETHRALAIIILMHALILRQSEEISILEVSFGAYLAVFYMVWLFRRILLRGENLITFRREYWLLIFLGLCFFSVVPTIITGGSALQWFRDLVPFATLFLYFPVSEVMGNSGKKRTIVISFLIMASAVGIQNIVNYRQNLLEAVYFWEIASARQVANEPLFLASIIILAGMFLYAHSWKFKVSAVSLLLFFGLAMVVTFSRGYWAASVIGVAVIFWYIDRGRKLKLVFLSLLFGIVAFAVISVLFGDITPFLTRSLVERAGSIAKAQTDISLMSRVVEAKALWEKIWVNPVIGYGLGSRFSFMDIIHLITLRTDYAHNAYLYLWFKLGIVGLISFMLFYGLHIIAAYRVFKNTEPSVKKGVAAGILALLLAMIPLSITSPQFIQKDSLLIIALVCAYISSEENIQKSNPSSREDT